MTKYICNKENVLMVKKNKYRDFLVVQWFRLHVSLQGTWVRSPVRVLGSHMLHGWAKNKRKKTALASYFKKKEIM